jgi:glycosyltransferase involved in cell wall biosynthesis
MGKIWLINQYASTPSTGIAGRHHYLARELAKVGHDVVLVAARWHHLLREGGASADLPHEEVVDGYRFVRINTPRYSHAHDKRRVLAGVAFSTSVSRLARRLRNTPDVVVCSSPDLLSYLGAERLARHSGARIVFEVRDMWPATLIELGGYSPKHPYIRFLQWIEDRAFRRADHIVSNVEGGAGHIASRGISDKKFTWVANGIQLDEVESPSDLSPEIAKQIPLHGLRIVYTGTLGAANSLKTIIQSMSMVRDLPDVYLLLVGQGRERGVLEAYCKELGLSNVRFLGPVLKTQVQSVLAACDVCYIGWNESPLYRWGIAANKIPEYLYSGNPIIHGYSGGNDPIAKFDAGLSVPAGDPGALAEAIRHLYAMPVDVRQRLGGNGHAAALEHYDYSKLSKKLEVEVLSPLLCPQKTGSH